MPEAFAEWESAKEQEMDSERLQAQAMAEVALKILAGSEEPEAF